MKKESVNGHEMGRNGKCVHCGKKLGQCRIKVCKKPPTLVDVKLSNKSRQKDLIMASRYFRGRLLHRKGERDKAKEARKTLHGDVEDAIARIDSGRVRARMGHGHR